MGNRWFTCPCSCRLAAICAGLALVAAAGCGTLRTRPVAIGAPAAHHLNASPFLICTNQPLGNDDPVIRELALLRRHATDILRLPASVRPIEVYIFDDQPAYQRFMKTNYRDLPYRRAYFMAQGGREVVYTFRGDRLNEDLRHEACHALVHSAFHDVPLWLDEGLAEYFECSGEVQGMHARHLADLQESIRKGWRPGLSRLESLTQVEQMTVEDYREAWGWVYYLLHGSPQGREILLAYLKDVGSSTRPGPLSSRLFRTMSRPDAGMITYLASRAPRLPAESPGLRASLRANGG